MWRRAVGQTAGAAAAFAAICTGAVAEPRFSQVNLKAGANVTSLHPALYQLEPLLLETWRVCEAGKPTITAGTDGRHRKNSYHYVGKAIDIRLNDVGPRTRRCLMTTLVEKLAALKPLPIVVILEGKDGDPNIHFHLHIDDGDRMAFYVAPQKAKPG